MWKNCKSAVKVPVTTRIPFIEGKETQIFGMYSKWKRLGDVCILGYF